MPCAHGAATAPPYRAGRRPCSARGAASFPRWRGTRPISDGSEARLCRYCAGVWLAIYLTTDDRSEEHTSELQSQSNLVCRLLLEKKKKKVHHTNSRTYSVNK